MSEPIRCYWLDVLILHQVAVFRLAVFDH